MGDNAAMLIQPSQADVRRFFCGVYAKARTQAPLEPMEMLVSQWIDEHPEYHASLSDVDAALRDMAKADPNQENPFLHLSMHLSISEQCSIDQPRGILRNQDRTLLPGMFVNVTILNGATNAITVEVYAQELTAV